MDRVTPSRPRWNRFVAGSRWWNWQYADAVAVAARRALAPGLVDQYLLDLTTPVGDGLDDAARATVMALPADLAKPRPSVPGAVADGLGRGAPVAPAALCRRRAQAVVAKPMADRRGTALELASDLADRHFRMRRAA